MTQSAQNLALGGVNMGQRLNRANSPAHEETVRSCSIVSIFSRSRCGLRSPGDLIGLGSFRLSFISISTGASRENCLDQAPAG